MITLRTLKKNPRKLIDDIAHTLVKILEILKKSQKVFPEFFTYANSTKP